MIERDPNIFILTVDSLRADAYGDLMGEVTSTIRGVEFTNAFATASNTGSSMPALAAGVFCDRVANGTPNLKLDEAGKEKSVTTLAEALSSEGYECTLWSDNVIFGPERNYDRGFGNESTGTPNWKKRAQRLVQKTGSDQLFNVGRWAYFNLFSPVESLLTSDSGYYPPAERYHQQVLRSLREETGGKMHWIHYMDVHHPFEPPSEYLEARSLHTDRSPSELAELSSQAIIENRGGETTDADIEDIEQAYLAACEYLRDQLMSFVDALVDREHYVPGHDLLVLTADHGEGFDRALHGMLGHTPTPAFWDDLVRVPLVVGHPEWDTGTVDSQVSQIDIVPTVLEAVDVQPPACSEGTAASTPADLHREHVYFTATGPYRTYHGVRNESGWKLFADRISDAESIEMTGMDEEKDRERVLLTRANSGDESIRFERELDATSRPSDTDVRERWLDLHSEIREQKGEITTRRFDASLSAETEEQLRQLGYVDNIR